MSNIIKFKATTVFQTRTMDSLVLSRHARYIGSSARSRSVQHSEESRPSQTDLKPAAKSTAAEGKGGHVTVVQKETIAERDAALMAKLQDMDGGRGTVEEKEWNGMARNVKENMVCVSDVLTRYGGR